MELNIKKCLRCFVILCNIFTAGCLFQPKRPESIIIILVDSWDAGAIRCNDSNDDNGESGIGILCRQSTRFSHAFSTSTMASPNIVSLMTGLYPSEHLFRSNRPDSVIASRWLPEDLKSKGYITSLYSAGAPINHRMGLHKYFDQFEDYLDSKVAGSIARSADLVLDGALFWINEHLNEKNFMVVYINDPLFALQNYADLAASEYRGKVIAEDVDQQIGKFLGALKKNGVYEKSWIIFAALSGQTTPEERPNEIKPLNLYSENVSVPLLVKPPNGIKLPTQIDYNITLADLGYTLFKKFGKGAVQPTKSNTLPRIDIFDPQEDVDQRMILIESFFDAWRGGGAIRYSVRRGHDLVIADTVPLYFNTLIDRQEVSAIPELPFEFLESLKTLKLNFEWGPSQNWRTKFFRLNSLLDSQNEEIENEILKDEIELKLRLATIFENSKNPKAKIKNIKLNFASSELIPHAQVLQSIKNKKKSKVQGACYKVWTKKYEPSDLVDCQDLLLVSSAIGSLSVKKDLENYMIKSNAYIQNTRVWWVLDTPLLHEGDQFWPSLYFIK
jgi:hypothetical protein